MNVLETMKQALDFAERTCGGKCNTEYNPCEAQDIATNLRAAIEAVEKAEPVAWMFVPIVKSPRVETAIFTTSRELALSWGYHGDKDLGHGTVTALGVIK